jgi:hypothetical protein
MIGWLSLIVSGLSFIVAAVALWNSRASRLDTKAETLFQLRRNALLATKACESEWQSALSELKWRRLEFTHANHNEAAAKISKKYFDDFESFLKSAIERFSVLLKSVENEGCSEEHAKHALRFCESAKVDLARGRQEMERGLNEIGKAIAKINPN